jgi:hypothetical protein
MLRSKSFRQNRSCSAHNVGILTLGGGRALYALLSSMSFQIPTAGQIITRNIPLMSYNIGAGKAPGSLSRRPAPEATVFPCFVMLCRFLSPIEHMLLWTIIYRSLQRGRDFVDSMHNMIHDTPVFVVMLRHWTLVSIVSSICLYRKKIVALP